MPDKVLSATVTAASTSITDVSAALATCSDGDELVVPAGTSSWTTGISTTKAIWLHGSGVGNTILQDDLPNSLAGTAGALWHFDTVSGKTYKISGIEVTGHNETANNAEGMIQFTGDSKAIMVWGNKFHDANRQRPLMYWYGSTCGVMFSNVVYNWVGVYTKHHQWAGNSYGEGSWTNEVLWGTTNFVYIEHNGWGNSSESWVTDGFAGARFVVRFNSITNCRVDQHGTESGGRFRGTRAMEVYGNTTRRTGGTGLFCDLRSGTAVICSNTMFGGDAWCNLYSYRETDVFAPWGGANATNNFDSNNVAGGVFVSGTHNGSSGVSVLSDSTKTWNTDQYAKYTLINKTTRANGFANYFGLIANNTATTASFRTPVFPTSALIFTNGDQYEIRQIYATLDMPGMGQCGVIITGDDASNMGGQSWPGQQIDMAYCWGNTWDSGTPNIVSGFVPVEGLHFTNGIAKPGWVPLSDPHPLVVALFPSGDTGARPAKISVARGFRRK